MRRFWSYENRLILILGTTFGFVFFDRNAAAYLAPFIAPDLHMNNTQIGLMASALSFTWAISGYALSAWSDRTGKRKVYLLVTIVVFSCCSMASGLAGSFLLLLAARMVMGAAEGPFLPIAQSLLMVESSEHRRGANMGWLQNFGSSILGSCLAPIVVVALAGALSWRATFFLAGLPGLVMALAIARYIHEPAAIRPAVGRREPVSIGALLGYRNIWLCMLMSIVMVAWMVLGWVMLPVYFVNYRHISPFHMSLLESVLGASNAAFGVFVPFLSDRFGRKPMMVLFAFAGILCPLASLYYSGSLVVLGILLFFGFAAGGVFPLMMSAVPSETVPVRYAATALGMVMGLGEVVGGVGGPLVGGWSADRFGLQAPLWLEAACALVGGTLAMFLIETAPVKRGAGAGVAGLEGLMPVAPGAGGS